MFQMLPVSLKVFPSYMSRKATRAYIKNGKGIVKLRSCRRIPLLYVFFFFRGILVFSGPLSPERFYTFKGAPCPYNLSSSDRNATNLDRLTDFNLDSYDSLFFLSFRTDGEKLGRHGAWDHMHSCLYSSIQLSPFLDIILNG